MVFPKTFFFRT